MTHSDPLFVDRFTQTRPDGGRQAETVRFVSFRGLQILYLGCLSPPSSPSPPLLPSGVVQTPCRAAKGRAANTRFEICDPKLCVHHTDTPDTLCTHSPSRFGINSLSPPSESARKRSKDDEKLKAVINWPKTFFVSSIPSEATRGRCFFICIKSASPHQYPAKFSWSSLITISFLWQHLNASYKLFMSGHNITAAPCHYECHDPSMSQLLTRLSGVYPRL